MSAAIMLISHENRFRKVNIQRAIEMVLVKNLELKKAELNFEKARLEYKKTVVNNQIDQSKYNKLKAKYNLKEAEKRYKDTRDDVIRSTIQQYIDLCLKKLSIKVKEKRIIAEKYLLEQNGSQHEMGGIINSVNLLKQRDTYNNACFELEKIRDEYTQSLRQFKMTLGLQGSEFELLEKPEVWEISEEAAIDTALENSLELQLSRIRLELAETDKKCVERSFLILDSKIKEITSKIFYIETESSKEDIIISTQKTYFQFKQAVKKTDLKKENLSKDKTEYELVRKQYEEGISTKADLLQYEVRLLETKYAYQEAMGNYYLAEHLLREVMCLETGVFIDGSTII